MAQFPYCLRQIYGRLRRKTRQITMGAENPPKKTCGKFATKKKHQTGKRPKMADLWSMRRGYKRAIKVLFSIEKSGLPHDR
jgi:hypothetical protein